MTYAILNPSNGLYTKVENIEERNKILIETAWNFFLKNTHETPYTEIYLNDNDEEVWQTPKDIVFSLEDMEDYIGKEYLKYDSFEEKNIFYYRVNYEILEGTVNKLDDAGKIYINNFIKTFKQASIIIPEEIKNQGNEAIKEFIKTEYAKKYNELLT